MTGIRATLKRGFDRLERPLDKLFGADWNPLSNLGPLGWFLFWVVAATGIYLFIFFDTAVDGAYATAEAVAAFNRRQPFAITPLPEREAGAGWWAARGGR